MAEWLRRLTRNQMGSSRVGSNPTCSAKVHGSCPVFECLTKGATSKSFIIDGHDVQAVMAEWLRRLTRNQMGSSRVGSNPTHSGSPVLFCRYSFLITINGPPLWMIFSRFP